MNNALQARMLTKYCNVNVIWVILLSLSAIPVIYTVERYRQTLDQLSISIFGAAIGEIAHISLGTI